MTFGPSCSTDNQPGNGLVASKTNVAPGGNVYSYAQGSNMTSTGLDEGFRMPTREVVSAFIESYRLSNESRLSCGALKKDSFLNLRAPPASSAC